MRRYTNVSEHGEQKFLFAHFEKHPPIYKYCVDVGAHGPGKSNTFQLINSGWTGLLIEPDPMLIPEIKKKFPAERTTVLNIAVSIAQGIQPLHLHSDRGKNSLLSYWEPESKLDMTIDVPTHLLSEILYKHRVPPTFDFLSIDTEGMDAAIMTQLFQTSHYRPSLVVTEATSYKDPDDLFKFYCYHRVGCFGTPPAHNLAFLRNSP